MKFSNFALTLATAGSIAAAQPHKHQHRHADKRSPDYTKIEAVAATAIVYEFDNKVISPSDVCAGLAAGRMSWDYQQGPPPVCSSDATPSSASVTSATSTPLVTSAPSSIVTPTSTASSSSSDVGLEAYQQNDYAASTTFSSSAASTSAPSSASQASSESASSSAPYSASSSSSSSSGQGLTSEFPSGQVSCSTFPSEYGAIEISWLGIGGWSGIQYPPLGTPQMSTAISGMSCTKGAMCSYACGPGYQKSQWPNDLQGDAGQSVGGLLCNDDGMLELTNPDLSSYLCIQGTGATLVKNELTENAAICRTDYPGTEDETVPLNTQAGTTSPLTCPDASTYYKHEGNGTSAQYYINNQGVSEADACYWNSDGSDTGNWAPSYLGVGQDIYGKTWLSISSTAQNDPTSYTPLNYTVEITSTDPTGLAATCRLRNGQYCSGSDYSDCNTAGCTVELTSGQAIYVLSENP